jgi:hypothetical protein
MFPAMAACAATNNRTAVARRSASLRIFDSLNWLEKPRAV